MGGLEPLMGDQVIPTFTSPNQAVVAAIDKDFRRTAASVVVAAHRRAVGSGAERAEQVAALDWRQLAVLGKVVTRLADGTHDIGRLATVQLDLKFVG